MCTVFQIIYVMNKLYIQSGCFQLIIHDISFVVIHVLWKSPILQARVILHGKKPEKALMMDDGFNTKIICI